MMRLTSLLVLAAAFLSGCTSGILRKPDGYQIKKVAIVSIYANHGVYNLKGGGGLTEGLSTLGSLIGNDKMKEVIPTDFGGDHLIRYSLKAYETELAKVNGWEVVPTTEVVKSAAYQKYTERMEKYGRTMASLQKFGNAMWKTPKGMVPYTGGHADDSSPDFKELQTLAQELNVDAVAVVKLDFAYTPHNAIGSSVAGNFGGTGTAKASVASSLKFVSKDGKIAVLTPEVTKGAGQRHVSDETCILMAGNINFGDKEKQMYMQAIDRTAQAWYQQITTELAKR